MMKTQKLPAEKRKQQILQTLVKMLENTDDSKLTTANIAAAAGVSEATLYRHFNNKNQLFEALVEFTENSIFSLLNQIHNDTEVNIRHLHDMCHLLLSFSDKNPGITRLIINGSLATDSIKLRDRSVQFFRRCESQFKQSLQMAQHYHNLPSHLNHIILANFIQAFILGKWQQFVLSNFQQSPLMHWEEQWVEIKKILQS